MYWIQVIYVVRLLMSLSRSHYLLTIHSGSTKIVVTPHVASHAPMSVVVEQILENDRRLNQGLDLCHQVDVNKGY